MENFVFMLNISPASSVGNDDMKTIRQKRGVFVNTKFTFGNNKFDIGVYMKKFNFKKYISKRRMTKFSLVHLRIFKI